MNSHGYCWAHGLSSEVNEKHSSPGILPLTTTIAVCHFLGTAVSVFTQVWHCTIKGLYFHTLLSLHKPNHTLLSSNNCCWSSTLNPKYCATQQKSSGNLELTDNGHYDTIRISCVTPFLDPTRTSVKNKTSILNNRLDEEYKYK